MVNEVFVEVVVKEVQVRVYDVFVVVVRAERNYAVVLAACQCVYEAPKYGIGICGPRLNNVEKVRAVLWLHRLGGMSLVANMVLEGLLEEGPLRAKKLYNKPLLGGHFE